MDEPRGPCIANEADHLTRLKPCADTSGRESRSWRIEMCEEHDVVTQDTPLANRVARDDRRTEERPDVDDFGLLLLMIERHQDDRRASRGREIDPAVADVS
jgi:hypothetical protein